VQEWGEKREKQRIAGEKYPENGRVVSQEAHEGRI
jgi:hypothetical protein